MDVFVYGTLTEHATTAALLDEYEYRGSAELVGLHRVDGRYPTLAPGGRTAGRILTTPEVDALDTYEGVDRGLYYRLPIQLAEGTATVQCYVGDPAALNVSVEWPGSAPFPDCVTSYCRRNSVTVRMGPPG